MYQKYSFNLYQLIKTNQSFSPFLTKIITLSDLGFKRTEQAIKAGYLCVSPYSGSGYSHTAARWISVENAELLTKALTEYMAEQELKKQLYEEKIQQKAVDFEQFKRDFVENYVKKRKTVLSTEQENNIILTIKKKEQATLKNIDSMLTLWEQNHVLVNNLIIKGFPFEEINLYKTKEELNNSILTVFINKANLKLFNEKVYYREQHINLDKKSLLTKIEMATEPFEQFKVNLTEYFNLKEKMFYENKLKQEKAKLLLLNERREKYSFLIENGFFSQKEIDGFIKLGLSAEKITINFLKNNHYVLNKTKKAFFSKTNPDQRISIKDIIPIVFDEKNKKDDVKKAIEQRIKQDAAKLREHNQKLKHAFLESIEDELLRLTAEKVIKITHRHDYKTYLEEQLSLLTVNYAKQHYKEKLTSVFKGFEYKDMFLNTRKTKREFIFYTGPTNSGKTYQAFSHINSETTGFYLSPLRLLALEGYETILNKGISCNLITGEERKISEQAKFQSSTIEVSPVNTEKVYDLAIIDEIGMLFDKQRGASWLQAMIAVNAKTIVLTGPEYMVETVQKIVEYLGETLKVVVCERKTPLVIKDTVVKNFVKGDALIVFSRRDVFAYKQALEQQGHSVSVVYGALSPEVRAEQARLFRDGVNDVLVSTDAVSMGLNLPIHRIIFTTVDKYNGYEMARVDQSLLVQIAGRAGRYGIKELGEVSALTKEMLAYIQKSFNQFDKKINTTLYIKEHLDIMLIIKEMLKTENLTEIFSFFYSTLKEIGDFEAGDYTDKYYFASYCDKLKLSIQKKYAMSCAPINAENIVLVDIWKELVNSIVNNSPFKIKLNISQKLQELELTIKKLDLYRWFYWQNPDLITNPEYLFDTLDKVNILIEKELLSSVKNKIVFNEYSE